MSEWIQSKAFDWPDQPPVNKIDTHHHLVPPFYREAVENAGGDPSGWPTPSWTITDTQSIMTRLGVQTAILSITAPGPCILKDSQECANLARKLNDYTAALRDASPSSIGFFATLPNVLDTAAALAEIAYALDVLNADGVVLFTRYGEGHTYLGHPDIEPIWEELNRRKAVIFVHPTHPVDTRPVNAKLPQPAIDYPHETTRSAMDMITSKTRVKFPDCKVILSHAGGTLPYLISRVTQPLTKGPPGAYDNTMAAFRGFYFDLALSASSQVVDMLMKLVPHDHILFGSDFPYAPPPSFPAFLESLENIDMDQDMRNKINFENAQNLFPRLARKAGAGQSVL